MMAFMFAFLAGLWSTAGYNCGYYTFCGYFFYFFAIYILVLFIEQQIQIVEERATVVTTAFRPSSVSRMRSVSEKLTVE